MAMRASEGPSAEVLGTQGMSETYVSMKIREALAASQGSRPQAQRLLMAWALADEQLLRGLATPHLKGIVAAAIDRSTRGGAASAATTTVPRQAAPQKLTQAQLDAIVSRMGGSRVATQPPILNGAPPPRTDGTQRQAVSVRTLAAAFARRKG